MHIKLFSFKLLHSYSKDSGQIHKQVKLLLCLEKKEKKKIFFKGP